jgi:hypothetical protein
MFVKDVRPVENVPFTFVASNNKIVFTISPDYFARVEGVILNISVKDVYDMHNNKSNTETWTAYVNRNPLIWDRDPVNIKMQEGELRTFTARIVNLGGTNINYSVENMPQWLTVSNGTGSLQPLASRELTFTVFQGVNIGNYETALGLTCGNGVIEILPVQLKVTGQRPDWDVNPYDFEFSMNITGQIKIDGVFQEDPDDLLGAFIGDLCVGVTSPIYVNTQNAYFTFADIYGNTEHTNQLLKFKLWDASTGRIYPIIETSIPNIHFTPSQIIGNTVNPVIFNALNFAEQTIPLKKGWTWVSNNVLNTSPTILNQMKTSLGSVGEIIKGQDTYIQQPGWLGSLEEISEKSMYMINTTADHSLILSGECANPAETPIVIKKNWNWIGYVPAFTLSVENALAGMNAQAGDYIKAQVGYVTYTGTDWVGSLIFMQPGKGYMYYSTYTTPQELIYPSTPSRGGDIPDDFTGVRSFALTPHWTVDISQYSSNMTMTAIVINNNEEMATEMIEIGAFSGDECRGSTFLQYVAELDRYIAFLMIYGEGNESITLKVYDHATATEHTANNAPVTFSANLMFGNPTNPYIVALGTDVTLSNLTVSEGTLTPVFSSTQLTYTVEVGNTVNSIIITATAADPTAVVTGAGLKTLQAGANAFTIIVSVDGGARTLEYTVTVNRESNPLSNVATLSNLTVSSGSLTPAFNSSTYIYTINITDEVDEILLTATPTDINATITGDGLIELSNGNSVLTIKVIAQDGVTELNYFVIVNRIVGINEPTQPESKFVVYPNPTTGELRITNYELRIENVEIFDVYGRKISSHHLTPASSDHIDISHLPAGVYFVRVDGVIAKVVKY